jgi:hypothetical protein
VSSSYYALFHLLTGEAVKLIGTNLTVAASHRVQRWFDHHEMKRVCGMFSVPTVHKQLGAVLAADVSPDLQMIARTFVQLQDARIDADYNSANSWNRAAVLQYAQDARETFAAWNRIRRTHEANVFAIALLSSKLFERER